MASPRRSGAAVPSRTHPAQLDRVVAALRERYRPERIILFGSYAWGTPREDSDVDLLIVKETEESYYDRCWRVRRLVREEKRGLPMDIIVYTPGELQSRLDVGDPLVTQIVQRGVVLHAS